MNVWLTIDLPFIIDGDYRLWSKDLCLLFSRYLSYKNSCSVYQHVLYIHCNKHSKVCGIKTLELRDRGKTTTQTHMRGIILQPALTTKLVQPAARLEPNHFPPKTAGRRHRCRVCWQAALSALQAGDISKQIEVLFRPDCKACPGG